jgi:hypothetical protein
MLPLVAPGTCRGSVTGPATEQCLTRNPSGWTGECDGGARIQPRTYKPNSFIAARSRHTVLLQLSTPCHSHLIHIFPSHPTIYWSAEGFSSVKLRNYDSQSRVQDRDAVGLKRGKPGPQAVPGAPAATPPCYQTAMQALGLSWRAQGAPPAG